MFGRFPSAMSPLLQSQSDCRSNMDSDTSLTHSGVYHCLSIPKHASRVNYQRVSLIAELEYRMEWKMEWNNAHSDIYVTPFNSCSWPELSYPEAHEQVQHCWHTFLSGIMM